MTTTLRSLAAAALLINALAIHHPAHARSSASEEARWFVLTATDSDRQLSYLLPLRETADIDAARTLIEQGPGGQVGSIVSARIAAGTDGYNRNLLDPNQRLWSWHVTGFEGFADFTIELCDGNPQLVEDDVQGWIANTGGVICFWGYTITAELDSAPGYGINAAVEGGWFNPSTPGQGLLLDVLDDGRSLFVAWFTFADVETQSLSKVGDPAHRWVTAQGSIVGERAELDVTLTTGGVFDDPAPVENSAPGAIGTLLIELATCKSGTATYQLKSGRSGSFPVVPLQPIEGC